MAEIGEHQTNKSNNGREEGEKGNSGTTILYDQFRDLLKENKDQALSPGGKKSLKQKLSSIVSVFTRKGASSSANGEINAGESKPGSSDNLSLSQNNNPSSSSSSNNKEGKEQPVLPDKVHGFHNEVMLLQRKLLVEEKFKAIGVVGMPGVGKTTLCQLVFDQEEVKEHFVPRIWIRMSSSHESRGKKSMVERILEHLVEERATNSVLKDHQLSEDQLLYALHLQLAGKRYLIVIDDVRETDKEFEELGKVFKDGFPKGSKGAVIVTSRSEETAKEMVGKEEKNLHRLLPLSDPESCWLIYRDSILQDAESDFPEAPGDSKKEFMKKCGGLPLAAKMMGEIKRKQNQKQAATANVETIQISTIEA